MRVIFANGTAMHFTKAELLSVLRRPASAIALCCLIIPLALFSPYPYLSEIHWIYQFLLWSIGLPLFVMVYCASFLFVEFVSRLRKWRAVPEPLVMLITAIIVTSSITPPLSWMSPRQPIGAWENLRYTGINLGIWELLAGIYFVFIFPVELRRHRERYNRKLFPDDDRGAVTEVSLGPLTVASRDLIHIVAQDHYLNVVTSEGSHLVPGRIARFAEEGGMDHGLLVHRSHWVSFGHVVALEREKGRPVLILTNGAKVPIARQRVRVVEQSLPRLLRSAA